MSYHVLIEVVEEETPDMFLVRVFGRSVWVPKAAIHRKPSLEPGDDKDYPGCVLGECDVQADIDFDAALKCGLAEPILPAVDACRTCRAPIRWCKTVAGKTIPIDAAPVEYGGTVVYRGGVAVTLKKGEPAHAHEKRFQSHFVTCLSPPKRAK